MAASKENRTISQFKSRLAGGGARPNLFEVELTLDGEGLGFSLPGYDATQMAFLCKAANLPAQNIASIDVPFRGRIFKVAGDRTIDTWTITIINDEDFRLRRAMEFWTEQIASLDTNLGATSLMLTWQQQKFISWVEVHHPEVLITLEIQTLYWQSMNS